MITNPRTMITIERSQAKQTLGYLMLLADPNENDKALTEALCNALADRGVSLYISFEIDRVVAEKMLDNILDAALTPRTHGWVNALINSLGCSQCRS
jgi:hypothetical protein